MMVRETEPKVYASCKEYYDAGYRYDGIYILNTPGIGYFNAYCV